MSERVPDFSLPNAARGPDPFSLSALPDDVAFLVLFLQRDHYCTNCRQQVQEVADRYDAFAARDAEVASIVPEPLEKVQQWQDSYDLPYPLLADPAAAVGEAVDQPVRFGLLGQFSDFFGRMPEVVVIDRRGPEATIADVHRGSSTFDRPEPDDLLAKLDAFQAEAAD